MTRRNPDRPRWGFAPVWAFAANRSRAAARLGAEARKWRKAAAVANALAEHRGAELLDARARITRLENNLDFLVSGRLGGNGHRPVTAHEFHWDDEDEFYDADLDGAFCDLCGRELECGQWGECDRCTGLDRCPDDLCHGAGRCMHRGVRSEA